MISISLFLDAQTITEEKTAKTKYDISAAAKSQSICTWKITNKLGYIFTYHEALSHQVQAMYQWHSKQKVINIDPHWLG